MVKQHFTNLFQTYGMPWQINFDNGPPWASVHERMRRLTSFSLWLIRLGIRVTYSSIRHPQTNGKDERFHQTLKNELLKFVCFLNLDDAQHHFDRWRDEYNYERPHEALGMDPPVSRYKTSPRKYPSCLPEITYGNQEMVGEVNKAGNIHYKKKKYFINESLYGLPVALRELENDKISMHFCHQKILAGFEIKLQCAKNVLPMSVNVHYPCMRSIHCIQPNLHFYIPSP